MAKPVENVIWAPQFHKRVKSRHRVPACLCDHHAPLPPVRFRIRRSGRIGLYRSACHRHGPLTFFLAVAAVLFAYANFVVMGYFKDISADRNTGYRTFPVVFGWGPAAVYSDLAAVAAAVLTCCALFVSGYINTWGIAIFAIAIGINLHAQIMIHRIRDESKTHGPIGNVVRAFILYCMAMTVTLKLSWIIFMALFYLLFELTLKLRPEKSQV